MCISDDARNTLLPMLHLQTSPVRIHHQWLLVMVWIKGKIVTKWAHWLTNWLAALLLINRRTLWYIHWLNDSLTEWVTYRMTHVHWVNDSLTEWLTCTEWMTHWLTTSDWLNNSNWLSLTDVSLWKLACIVGILFSNKDWNRHIDLWDRGKPGENMPLYHLLSKLLSLAPGFPWPY